jgi:hypothetical protein
MPNPNEQQDNNKIIEAAVNVGLAVEQANEATNSAILDVVARGEALGTGFNTEAVSEGLNKAWEGTKSVAGTAKNIAVGIGENWWDSYTKRSNLATLINGEPKQPTKKQIEDANQVVKKYSLDKQGIAKIPRAAFHLTTALPVCTDKAVLRCSFGIGVGPLTVLPMNRTQIGTPANYVATVMDFTPLNMPQFIMCGNILNPYVASASAIASAAAGCFVLVPMPCIGTRAPTPWIPTTKNTCGKMPLLTQTSCSTCWGIGSINILHCGQGLTNSYRFLVPGADGSTDYWATTKVMIESLVNLAGGLGGGITALSQLTKGISNAFKLAKLERVANATKNFAQGAENITNAKAFKTVTEAVDIGGNSIHLGMSIKEEDTAGITSDAINVGTSLAFKGRALYKENKAAEIGKPSTQHLKEANDNLAETNTGLREARREEIRTNAELGFAEGRVDDANAMRTFTKKNLDDANSNLNNAHENLEKADNNLTDAQRNYNRTESELKGAKDKQSEASGNLDETNTKQADAERKTQEAKKEFDGANTKLNNAKEKQADADRELSDAQKKKEEVYSNPNSTKEDKLAADMDVAMAKGNKSMADADVNAATKEKLEAESNYLDARSIEEEATLNTIGRGVEKQKADIDVINKQNAFNEADDNLKTKKTEYENAIGTVENEEIKTINAFHENEKVEGEWADAQSDLHTKKERHDQAMENYQNAVTQKQEAQQQFDEAASNYKEQEKKYNEALATTTGDKVASHVAGWGKDPVKGVVTGTITEREEAEKAAKEEAKKKAKEEAKGKMRDEFDAFLPD